MIKRNHILSFNLLEIGFATRKSRRMLLPPIKGTAIEGELIAVIGKNGIGKSTLLRTMAGLQDILSGELTIDGKNINDYSRIQLSAKIGYISTEIVKVSNMKVYDLVSLGRYPYTNWLGKVEEKDHKIIMESIIKTSMEELRDRQVTELSDGERQRAMIAMVLAQDATVMVMDEPTAFLDVSSKYEIIHLMHELISNRNKTIIFSTHDLATAVSQADKIWLLKEEGLFEGAPEDLMLAGTFNTLFDETKVKFNPVDGSYNIRNIEKGCIIVKGNDEKRFWTEKALIRAGYSITNSESAIRVEAPSELNSQWICQTTDTLNRFDSIYEMIGWIRDITPVS